MILQKHIVFTFLLGHIHNFSILRSKKYFWDLFFLKIKIVPKTETEKYILEKDVNMYLIFFFSSECNTLAYTSPSSEEQRNVFIQPDKNVHKGTEREDGQ